MLSCSLWRKCVFWSTGSADACHECLCLSSHHFCVTADDATSSHVVRHSVAADPRPTCSQCVVSVQIFTSRQLAIQVVHAYPWLLDKPRLLDVLAASYGELTTQAMQQFVEQDDLQHAADWQEVEQYLQCFTASDLHRHVPLLQGQA